MTDRRTVAGHTDIIEGKPTESKAPRDGGRIARIRADFDGIIRVPQPNLFIGGMEITELVTRLEETAKTLSEMDRTRRSGRKC